MPPLPNEDALKRAVGYFDEAKTKHGDFVKQVEKNYKSYLGLIEAGSDAAQWTSKAHPPYIQHIVETTLASLIDDKLRFRIRPRPTLETLHDPEAAQRSKDGAEAHQIIFDWQVRRDRFNAIQRDFALQNAIAGLTVAKTYWTTRKEMRRHLVSSEQPLTDENEQPIYHPLTGSQMTSPVLTESESMTVVYDGPTSEVVDVRDFLWHEAATSLDKARYVAHRVWLDKEDIEAGFAAGQFGTDRGGWDKETAMKELGESRGFADELATREKEIFRQDRTKDKIEVVEVWDNLRSEVTTVANRKVLLASRPFPFFHGKPPFVVCSTQPDLFRIPGISQVQKVEHLQTLLWSLQNQTIDNLQLVNNAIFFFRPDVEDPDEYPFEPGARWLVEDPTQVGQWAPNPIPAEITSSREALLKGDLQNLAGGFPFSSGTDSQNVDQQTATGASIISNIAQRSIDLAKQQVYIAWGDVGQQRMILNQQFIREPTVAPVLGVDNEEEINVIMPEILQGDFEFEIEPIADGLMKQEEQASAQALVQLAAQLAPIVAQLSVNGAAKMLNFDSFVEDLLRAFGKDNIERYFISQPAPVGPDQATDQGGDSTQNAVANDQTQETPLEQAQGPQGVTAAQSVDPAVSPSASISSAPGTLIQRALAMKGGGQSV